MSWHVDTAVVAAVVGAVSGGLVPRLIAGVPEPAPDTGASLVPAADESRYARPVDEPKEPYAAIAALPRLGWWTAIAAAAAAGLLGGRTGWRPELAMLLYLVPVCVALAVVDWRTRYLPTRLIAPSYAVVGVLAVLASLASGDWPALRDAAVGWLAAYLVFAVLWLLPGGLGYGDVRLAGLLGMALGWLGPAPLVLGLYTGFLLGGLLGLLLGGLRVFHRRHTPFGPHLVTGALLAAAFPDQLAAGYGWLLTRVVSLVVR